MPFSFIPSLHRYHRGSVAYCPKQACTSTELQNGTILVPPTVSKGKFGLKDSHVRTAFGKLKLRKRERRMVEER